VEVETLSQFYSRSVRDTWSRIYAQLSEIAFDKTMKMMMNAFVTDYKKLKESEVEDCALRGHFCRHLKIYVRTLC